MPQTPERKREYNREYQRRRRAAIRAKTWQADKASAIAQWARETLRVPTGPLAGKPFTLAQFQIQWLSGALKPSTREAALSCARKNGKSSLIAAALLAYLVGPLNSPQWAGLVISLTQHLSQELWSNMRLIAEASGIEDDLVFKVSPFPNIEGSHGARVTFLPASEGTGHAVGADLVIVDEAGLLKEKHRELWNNSFASVSGRNGCLWAISIRADGPMFGELLKRADSPGVFAVEYAASEDCALDDSAAWEAANPGLAVGIKSYEYMAHRAQAAIEIPANQPSFQSLDLNFPKDPSRYMIVSVGEWQRCITDTLPDRDGPCFVGVDLGSSTSMTGGCAYWPVTGRLEAWGAFPAIPDLAARGRKDSRGDLYLTMFQRGELSTYPGQILDVNRFVKECKNRLRGVRVTCAGADRHRYKELLTAYQVSNVRWPMEWRNGQNTSADASHDVLAFQSAVQGRLLKTTRHLMLESAIKQSSVVYDALGHPRLDKQHSLARIDALSAAIIGVGLGERWRQSNTKKKQIYHGKV